MSLVIKIVGLVNGEGSAFDGQYVVEYDPSRDGVEPGTDRPMMCHLVTTPDVEGAQVFDSVSDVHRLWTQVDSREPLRLDGKLNRPFTAFTIEVIGQGTPE